MNDRTARDEIAEIANAIQSLGAQIGEYGDGSALGGLLHLHGSIDDAARDAVIGLRARHFTWQRIGELTGVTKQAALMRWRGIQAGELIHREKRYERDARYRATLNAAARPHTAKRERKVSR